MLTKEVQPCSLEKLGDHRAKLENLVASVNNLDIKYELEGLSLEVAL